MAAASALCVSLSGPVSSALASFAGGSSTQSLTVSSVTPTAPGSLTASTCGITVVGVLDEQVGLSWTAPTSGNVTGYAIFVNGIQVATLPASQTTWTDSALLVVGTFVLKVRALYGSAQVWYADSSTVSVTYGLIGNMC
jgi:hypothetical protein